MQMGYLDIVSNRARLYLVRLIVRLPASTLLSDILAKRMSDYR